MDPLRSADPAVMGRYRILGRLGSGGMGVVYLAEGPRGKVALKLVRAELGDDPSFKARFRREVQASFRVSSAHTAKLIDFDTEADQPWMATEFVDGRSLEELVAADGPLSYADQLALATGLAQALVAIHDEDVVHRDLKPANVLITPSGPKVIDFGIAAAADAARITSSGLMVGSPGWLAPEQIEIGEATSASDVFAFGLVLCFAASGEPPFGSGTTDALLFRAMNAPPSVPLDKLARPLHRPVLAAISRDPARRPSPAELLEFLSEGGVGSSTMVSQALLDRGSGAPTRSAPAPSFPNRESSPVFAPTPLPYQSPYQPTPPPRQQPYQPTPPPYQPPYQPPGQQPAWQQQTQQPVSKRKRPGWLIPVAAVATLAVAGGAVALIASSGGGSTPKVSPTPSKVTRSTTPAPPTDPPIGLAKQTSLATAALVKGNDFPAGVVAVDRKAISLPCNLADQSVPSSAVLKGIHTSTASTITGNYVSETVAVLPTAAAAATIYAEARQKITGCRGYPSTFQNQTDNVTIVGTPSAAGAGDSSVYVEEKYTPANYKGTVTSTSTVLARRGPVLIRIFTDYGNQANRTKSQALAQLLVSRVNAVS